MPATRDWVTIPYFKHVESKNENPPIFLILWEKGRNGQYRAVTLRTAPKRVWHWGAGHDDSGEFVPLFSEQVLLNSIALNF